MRRPRLPARWDRRQRDRFKVEGGTRSAAAWGRGRAGKGPDEKGKRAQGSCPFRPALLYSILGRN
ncbi:MAG: hypothetical protein WB713_13010 [Methyloceanibacter sp.]